MNHHIHPKKDVLSGDEWCMSGMCSVCQYVTFDINIGLFKRARGTWEVVDGDPNPYVSGVDANDISFFLLIHSHRINPRYLS